MTAPLSRELALEPDPVSLARRLGPQPGLALLWTADGSGASYLAASPLAVRHGLDPEPELGIGAHQDAAWGFPRWIGVIPYESLREIERPAWTRRPEDREPPQLSGTTWFRYGAVARIDSQVTVLGDDPAAVERLAVGLSAPAVARAPLRVQRVDADRDAEHQQRIARALELIAEGQLYQVNLAQRFDFEIQGSPLDLLEQLARPTQPRFGACIVLDDAAVVSTSPELFLRLDPDRRVCTAPIKGTRPRAVDLEQDRAAAAELARDPKERAELLMVVDVERNDLGRVAEVGSVRMSESPAVHACGTVWHQRAEVEAILGREHGREALLRAMAPSGSVTGAPKVRAMEIIAALEGQRRGLYTGALGFVSHQGGMQLSMAIRTLTIRGGLAHYHSGGGIVIDSDPAREVEETRWKARQILDLCSVK